jgi:two-component system, OmpR family, copper resistance phosphate regulon response regulator CusR
VRLYKGVPKAHLLLIEDDPDLLSILLDELQDVGYQVTSATSLVQGLIQAREVGPDLIITDLGLPDGDGSEVVTRLRRTSRLPIIVLTARDDVTEKVKLLELGADDYLVKPVSPVELLARIAVQLRTPATDTVVAGPLVVYPSQHLATLDGEDLCLSPKELALLLLLLHQPGRVYTRPEIVQGVWDGHLALDSNVIDVHLSGLRQKLHQRGGHGLLRNVRGVGYALRVPVP